MVYTKLDLRSYLQRGDCRLLLRRQTTSTCSASTPKSIRVLNILKLTLYTTSTALLSCGDICPQPGPSTSHNQASQECYLLHTKKRGLVISHLNIRSLIGKLDNLKLLMKNSTKNVDILTLSETWLNNNIDDSEVNIPGYSIVRRDRQGAMGGGVAIYFRDNLPFTVVNTQDSIHSIKVSVITGVVLNG